MHTPGKQLKEYYGISMELQVRDFTSFGALTPICIRMLMLTGLAIQMTESLHQVTYFSLDQIQLVGHQESNVQWLARLLRQSTNQSPMHLQRSRGCETYFMNYMSPSRRHQQSTMTMSGVPYPYETRCCRFSICS
uniref:Putative ovule protein n=1 Tax=Solanum chacoense TaxID=4108 RepID=A0A0V0HYU7_SOLCH